MIERVKQNVEQALGESLRQPMSASPGRALQGSFESGMTQAAHMNFQHPAAGNEGVAIASVVPHVVYLAHDLDDAAIWRRVRMFEMGGARVDVAGFRRTTAPLPRPATLLGRTQDARLLRRVPAVGAAMLRLSRTLKGVGKPDVIVARNLEMLALASRARRLWSGSPPRVVYEVLDIHRMMLGDGVLGLLLRQAERRLGANVSLVLVSSPGFVRKYFRPYRVLSDRLRLVENKCLERPTTMPAVSRAGNRPLTIGWFGVLRCRWSLDTLDALTRANAGRFRVVLRGRPALDMMPDFHAVVEANPDLEYGGPYRYPDDLSQIYGGVRLAWLADRFDAGLNSDWLLPNRLYEGGAHGRVPIALEGTEVASFLRSKGVGLVLQRADVAAAEELLRPLSEEILVRLEAAVRAVPSSAWVTSEDECRALLDDILGRDVHSESQSQPNASTVSSVAT